MHQPDQQEVTMMITNIYKYTAGSHASACTTRGYNDDNKYKQIYSRKPRISLNNKSLQ